MDNLKDVGLIDFIFLLAIIFPQCQANIACGGTLYNMSGAISSPAAPLPIKRCVWEIVASSGSRIQINITSLDIEVQERCDTGEDFLEIGAEDSLEPDFYCGQRRNFVYVYPTNNLKVRFSAVSKTYNSSFSLHYNILLPPTTTTTTTTAATTTTNATTTSAANTTSNFTTTSAANTTGVLPPHTIGDPGFPVWAIVSIIILIMLGIALTVECIQYRRNSGIIRHLQSKYEQRDYQVVD